jgi:hypothetical protein
MSPPVNDGDRLASDRRSRDHLASDIGKLHTAGLKIGVDLEKD